MHLASSRYRGSSRGRWRALGGCTGRPTLGFAAGVITTITSMGVIASPRGLCLTATVTRLYGAKASVSQDVPLMVATGDSCWST